MGTLYQEKRKELLFRNGKNYARNRKMRGPKAGTSRLRPISIRLGLDPEKRAKQDSCALQPWQ
jgi:hypothetical protein